MTSRPGNGVDAGVEALHVAHRVADEAQVAVLAQVLEHGPRRGHRAAGSGAGRRRGDVPVVGSRRRPELEHLVLEDVGVARQDRRRALRRVAELVQVGRDRRHARDPEVEDGDRVAQLLDERQEIAADARVDVEVDVPLEGEGRELADRGRPCPG